MLVADVILAVDRKVRNFLLSLICHKNDAGLATVERDGIGMITGRPGAVGFCDRLVAIINPKEVVVMHLWFSSLSLEDGSIRVPGGLQELV
jgi:hypothetical protein